MHTLACLIDRLFFDVCDGIFLNYFWKESSLERSKQLSSELGRTHDVYVGVDIFGRGCYGGGGFNTVEVEFPDKLFSFFRDGPCGSDTSVDSPTSVVPEVIGEYVTQPSLPSLQARGPVEHCLHSNS